jgi:hypothetical protein
MTVILLQLKNKWYEMKNFKAYLFFIAAISCINCCYAQNEDMPDSRKKTESFERFRIPDIRKDLATFTLGGISESVGALPLEKISYTSLANDSILFEGDGIKAKVKIAVLIRQSINSLLMKSSLYGLTADLTMAAIMVIPLKRVSAKYQ